MFVAQSLVALMDVFVGVAIILVSIVLWLVLSKNNVWFFESGVIPAINVSFAAVLIMGLSYVLTVMLRRAWGSRGMRWSSRRRRFFSLALSMLVIQYLNVCLSMAQSAVALYSRCRLNRQFQMTGGSIQWTLWNAIFTLAWIDVQSVHPISTARVLRAHRPTREDAMVMDLPMYVHITKLPLTIALEIIIVAFAVIGNASFKRRLADAAALVPEGQKPTCEDLLGACRIRWDFILIECLAAIFMFVLILAYVGSLYRGRLYLSSLPYTKHRQANIFVRLQKRIRFPATVTMIACIAVYTFACVHLCRSSYVSALGYLPMHVVNSVVVSIFAVLATPVDRANRGILEVWLQEFAWTESDASNKRAERVSTIPKTEAGLELLQRSVDEPLWCFETTIRASYWSMLVYEYADTAVDAPMTKLSHAMAISHTRDFRLMWELDSDTKCVCSWGDGGIVLAFRGTASMTNMVTDIKVWRTRWPKGAADTDGYLEMAASAMTDPVALLAGGRPMVHSGFAEAWARKGVNEKVLALVRKIVEELAPMFAESDVEDDDRALQDEDDDDDDDDTDDDHCATRVGDADPAAGPTATADAIERGERPQRVRSPEEVQRRRTERAWRRARDHAVELYTPSGTRRGRVPILVTGHSLGGAIATLCAVDIAYRMPDLADKIDLHCYTFGCPRTGNRAFARLQNRLVPSTWHVINSDDAVVQSGKFYGLYKRGGHRVLINVKGDLIVRPSYLEHFALRSPGLGSVPDHFLTAYWRSTMAVILVQFGSKGMDGGRESAAALMRDTGLSILFEGIGINDEVVEALQRRYAARAETAQSGYTIIAAYTNLLVELWHNLTAPFAMMIGRGAGGRRQDEGTTAGFGEDRRATTAMPSRADLLARQLERVPTMGIQPILGDAMGKKKDKKKKKSRTPKSKSLQGGRLSQTSRSDASDTDDKSAHPGETPSPGAADVRFVESAGDVEAADPPLEDGEGGAATSPPPLSPMAASPHFAHETTAAASEQPVDPVKVSRKDSNVLRRLFTRHGECVVSAKVDPRVQALDDAKRGEVVGGIPGLAPVAYVEDGCLIHEYDNVETGSLVIGAAMRRAARKRGYLSRGTSSSSAISKGPHVGVETLYVGGEERHPHKLVHVDEAHAAAMAQGMLAAGGGSVERPATGHGVVIIAPEDEGVTVVAPNEGGGNDAARAEAREGVLVAPQGAESLRNTSPSSPRMHVSIELPTPEEDDENTP